jgi:hypothetical protein
MAPRCSNRLCWRQGFHCDYLFRLASGYWQLALAPHLIDYMNYAVFFCRRLLLLLMMRLILMLLMLT